MATTKKLKKPSKKKAVRRSIPKRPARVDLVDRLFAVEGSSMMCRKAVYDPVKGTETFVGRLLLGVSTKEPREVLEHRAREKRAEERELAGLMVLVAGA